MEFLEIAVMVATYLVTKGKEAGHAEWFLEGLWYPIIVSAVCFIIGMIYLDSKTKMLNKMMTLWNQLRN